MNVGQLRTLLSALPDTAEVHVGPDHHGAYPEARVATLIRWHAPRHSAGATLYLIHDVARSHELEGASALSNVRVLHNDFAEGT